MTPSEVPAVVRDVKPRLLEGLAPQEVKAILGAAKLRRYLTNSVVTNQEHPAEHMFLLLRGRARHFYITPDGQKTQLLWLPPGEIFGGAAFLSRPLPYLVSTETVKSSYVLVWDRPTAREFAARYPRLVENALLIAFDYLVVYRAMHVSLTCHTARQRLATVLVNLASGIGQQVRGGVELDVNNEELANEANVTLFTASRLLSEWQRDGMVVKNRGKVLLRSPEQLLSQGA
jgi:CRP/FNR family transcriptional regulator, nitrogen oxide reductase regulator